MVIVVRRRIRQKVQVFGCVHRDDRRCSGEVRVLVTFRIPVGPFMRSICCKEIPPTICGFSRGFASAWLQD